MLTTIKLYQKFSHIYYPFIISPTYELAEYSPAYMQDIRELKI